MPFDERVIEEFRKEVYANAVRKFINAFEEAFELASWLEDYQYCLDDAGKRLLDDVIHHLCKADEALNEFYWYFTEYLVPDRESGD